MARARLFGSKVLRGIAAGALLALSFGLHVPAAAQTTSGDAGAGATLFNANCNVGCHGATPLANFASTANAANAGGHIAWARANGMPAPALTDAEFNNIAAYIAQSVPDPNPVAAAAPFNASAPGTTSGAIPIPNIVLGTAYGQFAANLQFLSASKGTVTFSGTSATYRANACQTGNDTVTFQATRAGGSSNVRSFTVAIANPAAGPVFTSGTTANATTGVAFTYTSTVSACASLVSWGLTGAPAWLGIDGSGVVSGTPPLAAQGTSPSFTVNATFPGGASSSRTVTLTVALGVPAVTSAATAPAGAVGVAYPGYQITATNGPPFTGFTATGLPTGLTVNPATGLVSGTPTASGPFVASVTASNAAGASAPFNVTFNIGVGSPVVTSAATASGQTGVAFNYQITATNGPPFTGFTASPLPAGLTLDAATGLISGVPTALGVTNVTVTASNATGASPPFALAITITLGPPVITSPATASGGVAVPFSYQITATNSPTSFNATGLPAGLSVNTATGLISGAPSVSGSFAVTLSATNAVPLTGNAALTINIATIAPVITSPASASGQTGFAFSYQITADNGPTSFGATGLPPGLAVNTATGLVSGTPSASGTFIATLSASNGAGTFSQATVFTITVGPPVITSPATAGGAATLPFTYQITASNNPTSFGASGLPPGLAVNAATGLISGTPTANGTFAVTLSATNGTGTGSLTLTISLAVGPPVINSPATATGATAQAFSYQVTASGAPTSYGATGLPPGLAINAATGLISGTPAATGTFSVTLSATNATGTGTLTLSITISLSAPGLTSPATASGTSGQPFSYQITGSSGPTSFNATGLPAGLAVNTTTGLISGTPTVGGTFAVTVSATNATGTATQVVTITLAFVAPVVRDLSVDVAFQAPTPITLPISGQFTLVNIVAAPAHGTLSAPVPGSAILTYTSATGYSGGDSFTYSATGPGGVSGVATVTITVPTFRPVAATASMTVPLNTATKLDLAPFITGSSVTGVAIAKEALHGTVAVDGKTVTYTPKQDFFGTDSFQYYAYGNAGKSEPGVVNVTVVGRPDPTRDATVVGLLETQAKTARRFARAQLSNYQRRMETLHAGPHAVAPDADGAPSPAPKASAMRTEMALAPAAPQASGNGNGSAGSAATPAGSGAAGAAVAGVLASAASSQSVNLAALGNGGNGGNGASSAKEGTNVWAGGVATFGKRSLEEEGTTLRFSTDGVTVGADRRMSDRLALGLGVGYARDRTDIGDNGSKSRADGVSFAGYGSYQPSRDTFVDALFGFGTLDFESDRYVASLEEFATGSRKGRQVFGSLAAGYEFRREGVLLSPYGRVDFSVDNLDRSTESGAGLNALTYHDQTLRSMQAAAGLRLESRHETDFGWAMPRLRLEYRHEFENGRAASLSYADQFEGRTYSVTPSGSARNFLLLGVGADFLMGRGLRIGFDYQGERSSGPGTSQSVRLMLSQDLDGKGWPAWNWGWKTLDDPVNVEMGFTHDDNVTRGRLAGEKLSDQVYSLGLNTSRTFPITDHARAVATGLLNVDKFHDNTGLGRTSGGLQGELQYRASGDFDSVTYALFARGWIDGYESSLRSGSRYSLGLNARRSFTDRIDIFGEAAANWRRAESAVFEGRDWSAKLNVDYSLGRAGTAYLAGEYRRGDTFASGFASLWNLNSAEVFVRDDAFDGGDFFAYRFEARTLLGTLGYNRPLGPRDSIDFSFRRVQTTPLTSQGGSGPTSYNVNQYSILYLMRF